MEKLKELAEKCKKCKGFSLGVQVTINGHIVYGGIGKYLTRDEKECIPEDIYTEMVKTKSMVEVSAAPVFHVFHYDLDEAIDTAIQQIDEYVDSISVRNRKK